MHARIDRGDIVRAACLEQNRMTGVRQHRQQRENIFLEQAARLR